ncbi:MAG: hypothetical protein PHG08_01110 [Bacilli bacterium]|nr:hypothetical protein [Bacilli bacterium]
MTTRTQIVKFKNGTFGLRILKDNEFMFFSGYNKIIKNFIWMPANKYYQPSYQFRTVESLKVILKYGLNERLKALKEKVHHFEKEDYGVAI